MTIVYSNKKFPPPPFDQDIAEIEYFRNLYEGNHAEIFPRARAPVTETVVKRRRIGKRRWQEVTEKVNTANIYVIINFASLVAEIPADLINRALGNISADTETGKEELAFVEEVVDASKPADNIWSAVVQHQADGRIAYRIRRNEWGKTWFEWILGDQYLPHDDGFGADITWFEEQGEEENPKKYLRVERQRLEGNQLTVKQLVFLMEGDNVGDQLDINDYASMYDLEIPEDLELKDVDELLCGYVANDATLTKKRGRSALRDIDTIQEEINWTVTRDSVVFDKHGKPKLAIPRALWNTVADKNNQHYGQHFVRNADLEVVSYDENKGAVPMYITWDARLDQSFKHVERLIKYMMAVSKTSPQAAGLEEGTGQSGVALLYLWIQSVIKAEAIKEKFDTALKDAIRKCMILENHLGGKNLEVKNPVIEWGDMLPRADSERDTEESDKYSQGVQSLELTVRRIHPEMSEEAIYKEIEKIQNERSVDSLSPQFTQPPRVTIPSGDQQ